MFIFIVNTDFINLVYYRKFHELHDFMSINNYKNTLAAELASLPTHGILYEISVKF